MREFVTAVDPVAAEPRVTEAFVPGAGGGVGAGVASAGPARSTGARRTEDVPAATERVRRREGEGHGEGVRRRMGVVLVIGRHGWERLWRTAFR